MKRTITFLTTMLIFMTMPIFAQSNFKEYKAGHVFYVSLPDYMSKTSGLNDDAVIQFKSVVKDVAGFIIEDTKDELTLAQMSFPSINDFYDYFIKDFLVDQENRNISQSVSKKIGDISFMECDASYHDKDSNIDIYYFVGIAETKDSFYKVLCYGSLENKDKYKADFQKILYSIKD